MFVYLAQGCKRTLPDSRAFGRAAHVCSPSAGSMDAPALLWREGAALPPAPEAGGCVRAGGTGLGLFQREPKRKPW